MQTLKGEVLAGDDNGVGVGGVQEAEAEHGDEGEFLAAGELEGNEDGHLRGG